MRAVLMASPQENLGVTSPLGSCSPLGYYARFLVIGHSGWLRLCLVAASGPRCGGGPAVRPAQGRLDRVARLRPWRQRLDRLQRDHRRDVRRRPPVSAEPDGRAWARYCWITGTLSLVLEIGGNIGSPLAEKHGLPGLDQRASIIIGWVWKTLFLS